MAGRGLESPDKKFCRELIRENIPMETRVDLDGVYKPSEDVVARDLHGEFVMIPVTSGIGEPDDEIFSLNNFGKAIWDKLDGKRSLKELASTLSSEFEGPQAEIEGDCLGLIEELLMRKIIVRI